jgi:hypothetical protein
MGSLKQKGRDWPVLTGILWFWPRVKPIWTAHREMDDGRLLRQDSGRLLRQDGGGRLVGERRRTAVASPRYSKNGHPTTNWHRICIESELRPLWTQLGSFRGGSGDDDDAVLSGSDDGGRHYFDELVWVAHGQGTSTRRPCGLQTSTWATTSTPRRRGGDTDGDWWWRPRLGFGGRAAALVYAGRGQKL